MASTVLPNGIIIPEKFSRDWYADLYHNWQELDNLLGGGGGGANDGTLTIQKNGSTVGTFSANQATDETIDITVPTATSELTNDSNFVQSSDLATVATSGSYNDLSNTPTIPTVNDATLTIQKNGATVGTFSANQETNETINIVVPDALPTGSYIHFAGSQAPAGFLVCNGGAISRTTYSALFAVIGTTYGSGDGSTTFSLPNLTDRFLQGSTTSGTVKNAGLPNITGGASFDMAGGANVNVWDCRNSFTRNISGNNFATHSNSVAQTGSLSKGFDFNASNSNSIYGNSTTVQPPALTCLICIKY